jgi:hypothetical protein
VRSFRLSNEIYADSFSPPNSARDIITQVVGVEAARPSGTEPLGASWDLPVLCCHLAVGTHAEVSQCIFRCWH